MLGPFRFFCGDRPVSESAWTRKKAKSIFQYLALQEGKKVSDEVLAELFYAPSDYPKSLIRIKRAVSVLRRVLEPGLPAKKTSAYIKSEAGYYQLCLPPDSRIDVLEFQSLIDKARRADQRGERRMALRWYESAVNLYRGDFLADDTLSDWTIDIGRQYQDLLAKALIRLAYQYYEQFDYDRAITAAERLLNYDPWDEEIAFLLMKIHLSRGHRAKAVQTFKEIEKILARDLGLSPNSTLIDLYQRLI
jgi:DNA-binding SARP family transcriptional activator